MFANGWAILQRCVVSGVLLFMLVFGTVGANEAHWIEGEDYSTSTFMQSWGAGPWYNNDNISKDLLSPGEPGVSNGDWHSHYTSNTYQDSGTAVYIFHVNEPGTYSWWIRLNPFQNSNGGADYSYRIDSAEWQPIDLSYVTNRLDLVDPGIDIRFIAWTFGDTFDLTWGTHSIQIRISDRDGADREAHGGIDVMALVNFPWAPTGVIPPDPDPPAPQAADWMMLMAGPDAFSQESIIDMSYLLDKPAGIHGFLKRQGKDFMFVDATRVRFWGVGASMTDTVGAQQRQARFYAKHGINMVRQHPVEGVLGSLKGSPGNRYFDAAKLDKWDRWFSILKDEGIYMTWSIFYHHVVMSDEGIDSGLYNELPASGAGRDSYGLASFVKEYQDSQWQYAELLLNHVNPYTGLAYKDDPALAIVECRNEDSVFFHNPLVDDFVRGQSQPNHAARLKAMWQEWVKSTYGNNTALATAWGAGMKTTPIFNGDGSVRSYPDSVNEANMYIYAAWEMTKDGPFWNTTAERKRMGDFIRFLAEMQRDTYETYRQRLQTLGFRGVTVSTAWRAGGPAASAANLWTDDAMDAIDRHNYFGGGAGGHGITAGYVNNDTHMNKPGRGILSTGLWQVEDKPFIITEWTQKPPNQWKAEIAPLFAFYGMGLQGWDASYHFAASRPNMGSGWPAMRAYVTCTPHYIGQFPALAFAIYNNHFDEGDIVSARRLSRAQAFGGTDALDQEYGLVGYDENEVLAHGDTPVEALAIGRVTAKVDDAQNASYLADLSQWWDQTAKTVVSRTGQLTWDYGNRVVLLHSEKTQGVIGYAGGGTYDLGGVTVEVGETPFVSLIFTPLDNRPLIESEQILITAMARDKQYGTVYNEDGTELLETGGPPLYLEPVQATLTFAGAPVTSARVVDVYGLPADAQIPRSGNTITIDGRYATYYYEVRRDVDCASANIDGETLVDQHDFAMLAFDWMVTETGLAGDINADGAVDTWDLLQLARYWLELCQD